MPGLDGFKKRPRFDSVDGIVSRRLPKKTTHQYYRGENPTNTRPRHQVTQVSRRRPHLSNPSDPKSMVKEEVPIIGDFDKEFDNIFDSNLNNRKDKHKEPEEKAKPKKRRRIRSWWGNRSRRFKFGFITAMCLLFAGGLLGVRLYSFLNSVFARGVGNSNSAALGEDVKPEDLNTEGDGRLNILMMGRGGTENEAPDLTDTMLIASVDLKNQSTTLMSVPRDMWVTVNGSSMKINAAYSTGKQYATYKGKNKEEAENEGIKTAISAMRNVTGVPIHKYVLTDYKAFRDVVNALGGVDINVAEPIYDGFTGWKFKAGQQTMNGDTALKYARTRHGSARGDFDRNEHQRQLLISMRNKATSTGIVANPIRLNSIANAVQKNIRTDLSLDEAKTLFNKTKSMPDSSIISLDLAKPDGPLVTTGMVSGISVVRPTAGVGDYTKIRAYARANMVDPYLKKEGPTVAVYNASGESGLATKVGDILSSFGYKVLTKETAKSTASKTQVIRLASTDKPFTSHFLSVRFKTVIGSSLPENIVPDKTAAPTSGTNNTNNSSNTAPANPDYVIILGTDWDTPNDPTW